MISRLVIDSSDTMSELCYLGKATGTDKSPYNVGAHRHPYTAVYSMLFASLKKRAIRFAEIGVAMGASAILWDIYFRNPETEICYFDSDAKLLEHTAGLVGKRCSTRVMDVSIDGDVAKALGEGPYDIILDDSSHNHGHQIRIIKEGFPKLKSGGMMIIEDIFRSTPEEEYTREIPEILTQCSAAYFVICEHKDRWSPGWDNDKLLVLVKE